MRKIACVMMQKDEAFLLRPWLAYHGYLFGCKSVRDGQRIGFG